MFKIQYGFRLGINLNVRIQTIEQNEYENWAFIRRKLQHKL